MTIKELLATTNLHHPTAFGEAFLEFLVDREEGAPSDVRDQLRKCTTFNLNEMGELIELVYARREECGPILLQLIGKLAEFYDMRNYLGMRDRGSLINSVVQSTAGVPGSSMPDESEIPDILDRFVKQDEEEPVDPEPEA